jgi:hypothetical protein
MERRIRTSQSFQKMLDNYPVCVVANPLIGSHDDLPKLDFIETDIRRRPKRKLIQNNLSIVQKHMSSGQLAFNNYMCAIARPKFLLKRPLKFS